MIVLGIDITEVGTSATHKLGSYGSTVDSTGTKIYKYVKYDDGTGNLDLAIGDVVHYIDDTGYEAHTVGCDVSDLTGKGIVAGTAPVAVTTDASYFWMQIKGVVTLAVAIEASNDASPVTAADGDPLVVGDADKAARIQNTVIDADTERLSVFGVAIDATAKIVALDCIW